MKAVILAAGYGTRLGEITKNLPKPLVEVGGRPVIEHILARLNSFGINQIIVNLHYLPQMITEYLGNRVLYYFEPKLLGHKGTLFALQDWLKEGEFLVINGDTITNIDYASVITAHRKGSITACMDEWRCVGSWVYPTEYFKYPEIPVYPYRQENLVWFDIGTPERLQQARGFFEKNAESFDRLSKLRKKRN